METKNKIITIRENLIREIEDKICPTITLAYETNISILKITRYISGDEESLNGSELQRAFDYLNGLK